MSEREPRYGLAWPLGAVLLCSTVASEARADEWTETTPALQTSRWSVYGHVSSIGESTSLGVAGEYRPVRFFSISAGLGAGLGVDDYLDQGQIGRGAYDVTTQLLGLEVMGHFLFGTAASGPHSLELAFGGSVGALRQDGKIDERTSGGRILTEDIYGDGFGFYPSGALAYRFHPLDGGLVFRTGASINYGARGYVPLPMVSLGYAF